MTRPVPGQEAFSGPQSLILRRNAGIAAVAAALLQTVSTLVVIRAGDLPEPLNAGETQIRRYFAETHHASGLAQNICFALASVLLLWFGSGLTGWLIDERRISPTRGSFIFAGVASIALIWILVAAADQALTLSPAGSEAAAAAVYRFGVSALTLIAPTTAGVLVATALPRKGHLLGTGATTYTLLAAAAQLAYPVLTVVTDAGQASMDFLAALLATWEVWLVWTGIAMIRSAQTGLKLRHTQELIQQSWDKTTG